MKLMKFGSSTGEKVVLLGFFSSGGLRASKGWPYGTSSRMGSLELPARIYLPSMDSPIKYLCFQVKLLHTCVLRYLSAELVVGIFRPP